MIIGIPKEIKNNENRVSLTPSGAKELTCPEGDVGVSLLVHLYGDGGCGTIIIEDG